MWLLILLVGVPILEIALFIQVGGLLGFWLTIGIVIATAVFGSWLLRQQGLQTLAALQRSVADGRNPMEPIAHGALILVAGVVLLTPGFFTDALGLALLLPAVRAAAIRWGAAQLMRGNFTVTRPGMDRQTRPQSSATVEGDFTVMEDATDTPDGPTGQSGWTKKP